MNRLACIIFAVVAIFAIQASAEEYKKAHSYEPYDEIPLRVGKIGPYSNPSETYEYYTLPFCEPKEIEGDSLGLGEVLEGSRKETSLYDVRFRVDTQFHAICKTRLSRKELIQFMDAVNRKFYFQMFYDDLPVYGLVGEIEPDAEGIDKAYLFTHLHFDILYNQDRVIEVNLRTDPARRFELSPSANSAIVEFSFSATWRETNKLFENRMQKYNDATFFPEEIDIQWFSIINSLILVLLLTGFLAFVLMRILRKDYQRYQAVDLEEDEQEETGWKYLHGDVFRFPKNPNLFSAMVGTGVQLLVLTFGMLSLAVMGAFSKYTRGTMYAAIVIIYALTAGIAGYVSSALYKQMGGSLWVRNVVMTMSIFSLPCVVAWSFMNSVAIAYGSTAALPFGTVVVICLIWLFVTFPLTLLGAIFARNRTQSFDAPCRTKNAERVIPPAPWYRGFGTQLLVAGFLPFSAIYVELYYVFMSQWGHKMYTPYELVLLVFLILITVTACITIALTYFQLSMEDWRWWWRSLASGGATSIFVFAYCFFFYGNETFMNGFFQLSFYFGYMGLICYGLFLMLGTVGFYSSLVFVKKIYKAVKCD